MGDFPIMTEQGTFIINAPSASWSPTRSFARRAVQPGKDEKVAFEAPSTRAAVSGSRSTSRRRRTRPPTAGARIARKRRVSIFTLLRALDVAMDEAFFEKFIAHFDFLEDQFHADWKKAHIEIASTWTSTTSKTRQRTSCGPAQETAWPRDLPARPVPGEVQTIEAARQYFRRGLLLGEALRPLRAWAAQARPQAGRRSGQERGAIGDLLERPNADLHVLSKAEVLATATYLLNLARDRTAKETTYHIDDQDHFANPPHSQRRRTDPERAAHRPVAHGARRTRAYEHQDVEAIAPQTLINIRPVMSAIKEFFATSQLSQFMDQKQPLSASPTSAACRRWDRAAVA